jgi:hypothetical protein
MRRGGSHNLLFFIFGIPVMTDEERREANIKEVLEHATQPSDWRCPKPYAGMKNRDSMADLYEKIGVKMPHPRKGDIYYTEELGEYIAMEFATNPKPLKYLCKHDSRFPAQTVVLWWERKHPEFGELMKAAREIKAHVLMDEAFEIADDVEVEDKWGSARVSKAKLQMSIREKLAKRFNQKEFGDKFEGNVNVALTFTQLVQTLRDNPNGVRGYIDVAEPDQQRRGLTDFAEESAKSGVVHEECPGGGTLGSPEGDPEQCP